MDHEEQNYGPMVVGAAEGMDDGHGHDAPEVVEHYNPNGATDQSPQYTNLTKYGGAASGAAAASIPLKIEPDRADPFEQARRAPINAGSKPPLHKRYRRGFIIGGVLIAIIIILAAVLGGVLGSRAAHKGSNKQTSNSPLVVPQGQNLRLRSTQGAFNGTGLATYGLSIGDSTYNNYLIYQDWNGTIKQINFQLPTAGTVTASSTSNITHDAANGTAVEIINQYDPDTEDWTSFQLVYVNSQNVLADLWVKASNADVWKPGNLSKLNFRCPTDNRASIMLSVPDIGTHNGQNITQLIAGGEDGQLHSFTMDIREGTWTENDHTFDKSWAYGGIEWDYETLSPGWNLTVYSTLSDGTIQYQTIIMDDSEAVPSSSPNEQWTDTYSLPSNGAHNTSFNIFWQDTYCGPHSFMTYVDPNGKLQKQKLDLGLGACNTTGNAGADASAASSVYGNYMMMLGSDTATSASQLSDGDAVDSFNMVIFHQTTGDDISWVGLYANGTKLGSGAIDTKKL